jgi:PKD domain-containing protein
VGFPESSRSSVDAGQSITLNATIDLGSAVDSDTGIGLPPGCGEVDANALTCAPDVAGPYTIYLKITDSNSESAETAPILLNVDPDPVVALTASRTAFVQSQSVTLLAVAANGSGGFTYGWSGLPAGCAGSGASIRSSPATNGTYSVSVQADDANGYAVRSAPVVLTVASRRTTNFTVSDASPAIGELVTFTPVVAGGTAPLNYTWTFGDGTASSGATVQHRYTQPGAYIVTLGVNDSAGWSLAYRMTLSVAGASSRPGPAGVGLLPVVVGVAAAVAGVGLLIALWRRRRDLSPPEDATEAPVERAQ